MARGPDMRVVELVDTDHDALDDSPPPATAATGAARGGSTAVRAGRASWRRRLAVAVVLGLVAAGVVVGEDRREGARLAALADVPGVVAPLDGPVRVRWGFADSAGGQLRWIAGHVVAVVQRPRSGVEVVGLDGATGAERWRTPVSPPGRGSSPSAQCDVPTTDHAAAEPDLVCLVVDDTDTADAAGIASATYPTRVRLVVLDPRTGDVVREQAVPPTTLAAPLGTDVLLASVDDDHHARVARVDPRDGTERWSFRSPEPIPADRLGQRGVSVQTDGRLVVLAAGTAWVLDTDGERLRTWPEAGRTDDGAAAWVQLLEGRGVLVRGSPGTASGSDVLDVATGRTFVVDGYPAYLFPDDGSLADVMVVERGDARSRTGYALPTGRELWTVPATLGGSGLVLDGRVVDLDADRLRSFDGRTGEVVWSGPAVVPDAASLETDGRVLLVGSAGGSRDGVVTAYGVDDGRERWSTRLGTDVHLFSVDGALLGFAPHGVVVLAPPPGEG